VITEQRTAALGALLALGLTNALLWAAPAHASLPGISCTGWTHASYTPGLTTTVRPTTVVVDGDLNVIDDRSPTGSCLSVGSSATAGERDVTALLDLSCTQLIVERGTETITWNDGRSTSFAFSADVARLSSATVITETGTVTSGEFLGGTVIETFTAPNTALTACGTTGGVRALDFATVLTITPDV
jgi:hypothetical protein